MSKERISLRRLPLRSSVCGSEQTRTGPQHSSVQPMLSEGWMDTKGDSDAHAKAKSAVQKQSCRLYKIIFLEGVVVSYDMLKVRVFSRSHGKNILNLH